MLTVALYALLAIGLAAALFFLAVRFLPAGEQLAPVVPDEPLWTLPPDRTLSPDDVASVRIPVALRGYRFAETDLLLDRLGEELRRRDETIARLRGGRPLGADEPADQPMLPYVVEPPDAEPDATAAPALAGAAPRPVRPERAPAVPPPWWREGTAGVHGLIADHDGGPIVHRLDEAPTTVLPLAELALLEPLADPAAEPVAGTADPAAEPAQPRPRRFGRRSAPGESSGGRRRRSAGEDALPILGAGEATSWWSRMSDEPPGPVAVEPEPQAEAQPQPQPQPEPSPEPEPQPEPPAPPQPPAQQPSSAPSSSGWTWLPPPDSGPTE